MRKNILGLLILINILFIFTTPIFASSEQAYKDYTFQYDKYRESLNEFKIAKNEYEKFKTLTSETTALDKTKTMLGNRDSLLKSYLFLLNEKLSENTGLSNSDRSLYQTLMNNEVKFLETHSRLITSIGSLNDCVNVSEQLESHYNILQTSIRQIIIGLGLGHLNKISINFDKTLSLLKMYIYSNKSNISLNSSSTIDRWIVSTSNKRSLYQQKIDSIINKNSSLKSNSINQINENTSEMQKELGEAKAYITEATSYLNEVMRSIKYQE
jgi:hypothetical protein